VQVRIPRFELRSDIPTLWLAGSPFRTHFFDALSLLLPAGERFFIDAVRDRLPALRDASTVDVRAFLGQEAWHSRVHLEYNRRLEAAGYPALRLEQLFERRLVRARRLLRRNVQLATTVGAEHLTTLLAAWLLENPSILDGADEEFSAIWRWHSAEELEHKDVTATVYRAVAGGYWLRVLGMLIATGTIASGLFFNLFVLLRRGRHLLEARTYLDGFRLLVRDGFLTSTLPRYLAFFHPRFRGLRVSVDEHTVALLARLAHDGKLSSSPSATTSRRRHASAR
jgi:predicted metal-dependent hydrolase